MGLKVIGAGLGRTGTLSLKLALEHIGFGPCYHMSEMLTQLRKHLPLWIESAKGNP
ncbi:MAG: sulfotransferase, partial [Croceibacterium sp.]